MDLNLHKQFHWCQKSKTSPQLTMAKYYQYDQRCLWKEQTMDEVFLKVKVQRGKGKKHWPDEWVPSSLLCHIFALRHHKYELYVPPENAAWTRQNKKYHEQVFFCLVQETFYWIALIALVRVRPAISQLVKFNLQDLQLMNNIEENIASEGASPSNPLWTWTIRYGIAIRQHWHRRGIQETTTNGHDLGQTL